MGFDFHRPFNEGAPLIFTGDGRMWLDFNFGVNSLTRGSAAPNLIDLAGTDIETLGFDGGVTTEEVSIVLELNHNWAEGTLIKPHVHWYPTTTDAGNVNWQMEYVFVASDAVVGASTTINVIQAAGGVAWTERFASFADIVTTGLLIGTQMHVRLFRDPTDSDTYGADAALATFGLHVLIDSLGSREVTAK
jgi:hypothetical protein